MSGLTVRWSDHALDSLSARNIERRIAELAIEEPEQIKDGYNGRKVFQRRFKEKNSGKERLVRVVLEEMADHWVVVTVYKTSQIAKYAGGEGNESQLRH